MNGGTRHSGMSGSRTSRDRDQQADAAAPPPAAAETNRRSTFSLPSLRGTDIHIPYTNHASSSLGFPAPLNNTTPNSLPPPSGAGKTGPLSERFHAAAATADRTGRPSSTSNSQETNTSSWSTNGSDPHPNSSQIYTDPTSGSDGGASLGNDSGSHSHDSSQESQLFQLSQLAAAQEKMPAEAQAMAVSPVEGGGSRKRLVDGTVKSTRDAPSASPVFGAPRNGGHSRNVSSVSTSTAGSRIGDVSDLRTRLKYAMVKVNQGWGSHPIEQVESMSLSQAASPSSTTSTIHCRNSSSASPMLPDPGALRIKSSISPATDRGEKSVSFPPPALAPPAPIQPTRSSEVDARRSSNPPFIPPYLSQSGYHASPKTPHEPASAQGTPRPPITRTPLVDPILFSPHQNVREQDAIESLLFMSSPGNSANLKHSFQPSSSQQSQGSSGRPGPSSQPSQRTALPTGQPRKSLPTSRPAHHSSQPPKRVGFEKSPSTLSAMEVDDHYGSPQVPRGTPRQKLNGQGHLSGYVGDAHQQRRFSLKVPRGLDISLKKGPALDIDKMLDHYVDKDKDSDSEGEIQIPVRSSGTGVARTR